VKSRFQSLLLFKWVNLFRYGAVHEYTHAVQGLYGDQPPNWLLEGGAVHMVGLYTLNQVDP
jgi:hypothetical protein